MCSTSRRPLSFRRGWVPGTGTNAFWPVVARRYVSLSSEDRWVELSGWRIWTAEWTACCRGSSTLWFKSSLCLLACCSVCLTFCLTSCERVYLSIFLRWAGHKCWALLFWWPVAVLGHHHHCCIESVEQLANKLIDWLIDWLRTSLTWQTNDARVALVSLTMLTRKSGNCECIATQIALRPPDVAPVVLGCVFSQFCTAHAQKLLFCSYRSKFWHRH